MHVQFSLLALLRDYSNSFNLSVYNAAELCWNKIGRNTMFKLRQTMGNVPSCHVLHKTLNLVFSRCCFVEDGEEMYQNL